MADGACRPALELLLREVLTELGKIVPRFRGLRRPDNGSHLAHAIEVNVPPTVKTERGGSSAGGSASDPGGEETAERGQLRRGQRVALHGTTLVRFLAASVVPGESLRKKKRFILRTAEGWRRGKRRDWGRARRRGKIVFFFFSSKARGPFPRFVS